MSLTKIFEPLKLGPVEVPNRVVRTAHGGLEMAPRMTDDYIAYHARRGKGGCGLTILGAASVHPSSQLYPMGLFYDGIVEDYRRLMAACSASPMKVFAQLWHGGNLYPAYDELVRQAAKDSIPVNRELWAAREKESEAKVRAAGVEIIDEIDKTPFIEAMVPVYQKHANTPVLQSLVERIQATE